MKSIVVIGVALVLARSAVAQGTVRFANRGGASTTAAPGAVFAPVYREDPNDPTRRISGNTANGIPAGTTSYHGAAFVAAGQGPTFTATLWGVNSTTAVGSASQNNLQLLLNGTTTFRTSTSANFGGIVNEPPDAAPVPGVVTDSDRATFQVRVWDTRGGTISTWDQLLMPENNEVLRGYSDLFTVPFPLAGILGTPATPPYLQGLESFNLFIVPEPSVLVLGFFAAAFLVLFRRRKERNRFSV
jgi:hypothetical protein